MKRKSLRILFCSNEQLMPLLGGGSAGNLRIVQKMVERGHQVTATTPLFIDKEPLEKELGIKIIPFSPFYIHRTVKFREARYSAYVFLFTFHLLKLLHKNDFDCIFLRNCILAPAVLLGARWKKLPIFISMTDIISGFLRESWYPSFVVDFLIKLEKRFALACDGLFVITGAMRDEVLTEKRKKIPPITISYDGVDTNLFNPQKIDENELKKLKEDLGICGRTAIYHGVIDPYHGIENLELILKYALANTDLNFLIIAKGMGYERIKKSIQSSRVKFLDFIPYHRIPYYIAACDAGFIPYRPNYNLDVVLTLKLLEYLAMGLPVVTFGLKSVKEIFGKYQFLTIVDDVPSFCQALQKNSQLPKSQEAVQLIHSSFSWDNMTNLICDKVEELTAKIKK